MIRVNTNVLDSQAEVMEQTAKKMEYVLRDLDECSFILRRHHNIFDRETLAVRRQMERIAIGEKKLFDLSATLNAVSHVYTETESKLRHPKELVYMNGSFISMETPDIKIIPGCPKPNPIPIFIPWWKWSFWKDRRPKPKPGPPGFVSILWPRIWPPRRPRPIWDRYRYYGPGSENIIWRRWIRRWFWRDEYRFRFLLLRPVIKPAPIIRAVSVISFEPLLKINTEIDALLKPMLKGGTK